MSQELCGKRLLILGATPNEIPLVERAKSLGVYTVVTDYNLDHTISPAKDVADEYWDISWSDIDRLEQKCREREIDGAVAGFSEFRVDCLIQLCERLGLPCYATPEQLAVTRDKSKFKSTCEQYGVPVIHGYASLDEVCHFPIIVKPVDRAGSIGVGIAYDQQQLASAFENAMEKSVVKQVILEDYITDATEMDVHYAICDGEITLLCTDDIVPAASNQEDGKVIQSAWLYPCRYEKEFLQTADGALRAMIRGLGIQNGTIFFSGFVNQQREFSFFECGFRLWGEQEFQYDYRKGLMNYLDIYIYHALTGNTFDVRMNDNGNALLKGVALNMYAKAGVLSRIDGVEALRNMPGCDLVIVDGYLGQVCDSSAAILSKIALLGFSDESPNHLRETVLEAYRHFSATGDMGEDMVYDRIDVDLLLNWWND